MNKKDFDNDEIDLEGIENDPDLLRELAEIDEELYLEASSKAISNPTTKKISTQKSSSTKATDIQNINLDISHLLSSNTDNLHVDFNEDDENDPELLAALEGLKDDFINTHEPETKHSRTELSSALLPQLTIVAADTTSNVKSSTSPITSQTKSSNQLPVVAVSSKPTPAVSQSQTQLMVPKSASTTPSKVSSTGDTSLRTTSLIAQYKQKALVFKKEGRLDEAKEWLIKAKNLEKCEGIKVKQAKERDLEAVYESIAATSDAFGPLEHALEEVTSSLLDDAKREKAAGNKKQFDALTQDCKRYIQELEVLKARRHIPGALPALFRWQAVRKEKKIENLDLAEDQVRLEIKQASRLQSLLQGNSSRSLILTYDLGFPKDSPFTGKLTGTIDAKGNLDFEFSIILAAGIKRSAHSLTANSMTRKKAQFNLILKRGMFYSDIPLGEVTLPLADLQTKCECGGVLPIMQDDDKGRRKSVGGTLEVYIRLRSPISQPQVEVTEDRVLVIGPWPEIDQIPVSASQSVIQKSAPILRSTKPSQSAPVVKKPSPTEVPKPAAVPSSSLEFSDVLDLEKSDPLNVAFLLSNDVLEAEVQSITTALASPALDSDAKSFLDIRLQSVNIRLSMLERGVTSGTITMEAYLAMLRERVARDKRIVAYLGSLSADDRDLETERKVKQRMIIMLKEIKGAEESM